MAIEDGQFKKGHAGGPGRPPKSETYSDTLRSILEAKSINIKYTYTDKNGDTQIEHVAVTSDNNMYYGVAAALIREALAGSVQAQKEIADRVQGKAPQTLNVTEKVENLDDKLRGAADLLDEAARANRAARPNR